MCIKSNLLKLKFFTSSNSNIKCTVNKTVAGIYSMFFIYSSRICGGNAKAAQGEKSMFSVRLLNIFVSKVE